MGFQVVRLRSGVVDGIVELSILVVSWLLGGYLLARLSDLRVNAALKRGENLKLGTKFGVDWQTFARVYVLLIAPVLFLVASLGRDGSTQRVEIHTRGDVEFFDSDFVPRRFNQDLRTIAPLLCGVKDGGTSAAAYLDSGEYCKPDVPSLESRIVLAGPQDVIPPPDLFPPQNGSMIEIDSWASICFDDDCRVISVK